MPAPSVACATVLLAAAHLHSARAARQALTFDYNWKFQLGDPEEAEPPLQTASMDPTFTNISSGYSCTQLAWSQLGRMGPRDCTGACSATPVFSPLPPSPSLSLSLPLSELLPHSYACSAGLQGLDVGTVLARRTIQQPWLFHSRWYSRRRTRLYQDDRGS